jgi:hypothetical protein
VQVEDELRGQKAIYDSTVEEMLQLNNNYNELKQVRTAVGYTLFTVPDFCS